MSNAHGNTGRDIRKFLRENGIKPTIANVERIGREVRRGESANERVESEAKERGEPTRDAQGPVEPRVRAHVQRELRARREREGR